MALSNKNILAAMLERATNPAAENVDELAVQIFCVTVRNDPNLIHEAMSLIVSKIQSSNVTQSIRGVSLLEECMDKCGSTFQDEVSKFRFLNDLIRLVSNKYQGKKTPAPIRDKIMDCLLLWTTEYPDKMKIREAYDLLRKEGTEHAPTPAMSSATTRKDTIMGVDEEKFRKLVQSKNAEDFKRANLLVQARVNQEAKRMELMCRHKSELQEIKNTTSLLGQMLDTYEKHSPGEENETVSLIKELFEACENYVPIIEKLPELIDNTNDKLIEETLEVNDYLQAVIERYKTIFLKNKTTSPALHVRTSNAIATSDLLSGLLAQPETSEASASKPVPATPNPLDELTEIFGNMENSTQKIQASLFENINLLEPSTVAAREVEQTQNEKNCDGGALPKYDSRKLTAIDIMSEELLQASLQSSERIGSFKKEPERVSLNDLAKEKTINDTKILSSSKDAKPIDSILSSPILPKSEKISAIDENFMKNSKDELILGDPEPEQQVEKSDPPVEKKENLPVVHLADIQVDLDDVCPTTEKLLFDDDIKITLNFTSNRPSPNVSVIVVSVTNQSKLPVTSFHFDASVRKPSKVRLLPATGDSMPGTKPFRPPQPINLVMLLLNPTKADVDVTCIVGYKLGDDPDPIKESIVARNIAYVE